MTFADLTTPFARRKVFVLAADSSNRAVVHHEDIQQIRGTLYRGRDQGDSWGGISCDIYIYYESLGWGVAMSCVHDPAEADQEASLKTVDFSLIDTPEAFMAWMDYRVEKKQFINNAYIALARKIDPERVPVYEKARLDYYAESKRRDQERQRAREAQDAAYCKEENAKADAVVAKAVEILRSGGQLENTFITYYKGRYDGMTYSVINHIARLYGVSIPISVQGWINRSLSSMEIQDGHVTRYWRRGKSKSNTVGGYLDQLITAVRAAQPSVAA